MEHKEATLLDLDNLIWDEQPFKKIAFPRLYEMMINFGVANSIKDAETRAKGYQKVLLDRNGYYSWNEVFHDLGGLSYLELLKQNKELIKPFPGVLETLDYLYKKYPLALVTDSARNYADFKVDTLGIRKYFPVIITTDETRTMEPKPTGWLMAAKELKVNVDKCIGIGDNAKDAESLNNANIETIIVNSDLDIKKNLPSKIIFLQKFEELKGIL